MEYYLGN